MNESYIYVNMPEHPRANKDGLVYEHIIVAEKKIGRSLKVGEVVHHEDRNRRNNSEDNIYVFSSNSDHSRYHRTGVLFTNLDGTVSSPMVSKSYSLICKVCRKSFDADDIKRKFCSQECSSISQRKCRRPTKEELDKLMSELGSMVKVGKHLGVTDTAIRKWYTSS